MSDEHKNCIPMWLALLLFMAAWFLSAPNWAAEHDIDFWTAKPIVPFVMTIPARDPVPSIKTEEYYGYGKTITIREHP